jgi:dolichyl-phosphate-mannose-protein mannosyltransferase
VTELGGLLWLAAGLGGLLASAGLGACCLRIRSPIEFALATYVLAWIWLVAVTLGLSPARLVTRGWLIGGIGAGLLSALGVWLACGRPGPPDLRPALKEVRHALHSPALLVLALAVILGAAYSIALALFTPVNEGDSLSYHLARAALWKQEHGLSYVPNAVDIRLNGNPPNAEIGQLATMLLSGSDRYVALPQLSAYGALVLCVAGLARRLGLSVSEALFGALAFATLPVVVLQASGALNDLVVASFLAVAALFCLRPGRSALVLVALAIGLALGTKLTTVLALPTLAIVVALGRPRRQWLAAALAGLGGLAVGSVWYVVNLAETGELDGGLAGASDQGVELSVPAVSTNAMRFALDVIDMSGAPRPYSALFLAAACVVAVLGLWRARRSIHQGLALLVASALTASIFFTPLIAEVGQDTVFRAWIVLGRPASAPFE